MILKMTLTVSAVAHKQAGEKFLRDGLARLSHRFRDIFFEVDDQQPEVLLFLSGGSELSAINKLSPDRFTLLLASSEGNAFASAMEVKAWASGENISTSILDMDEPQAEIQIMNYARAFSGLRGLKGQSAAIIGEISPWLVASALKPEIARDRLGIDIVHLPWRKIPDYLDYPPHPEFLEVFANYQKTYGIADEQNTAEDSCAAKGLEQSVDDMEEAANPWKKEAGIYTFLLELIREHHLDALTLECFDLVNDHHVTACLSLALLNSKGLPAGCEGDLVSLAGMMLVKAVTDEIPWMANVAAMNDDSVLFAHCTAPLNLLDDFTINTHFETDKSAAIAGQIKHSEVTIFRMDQKLKKAFIAPGHILSRPVYNFACRTQTQVAIDPVSLRSLKEGPLGNHHLIVPGNQAEVLQTVCTVKQIDII